MSYYYGGFAPYVPVAERRKQAEREVAKLRKKGQPVSPVKIEGRTIARSFWGKAWCENLEDYRDYENRLPRGRSYVRNGSVVDLQIAPQEVTALVSGSSMYTVKVTVAAVPKLQWQSLCRDCAGGIDSLVELLQGRFSNAVMERICRQDTGLFPKPSEIKFRCSCPDSASMCKHVAAVLYGVGARLDDKPELLFHLRGVDGKDLASNLNTALPLSKKGPAAGKVLESDDFSALFGLDMDGPDAEPPAAPAKGAKGREVKGREAAWAKQQANKKPAPKAAAPVQPVTGRKPGRPPKTAAAPAKPQAAITAKASAAAAKPVAPRKPGRPPKAVAAASAKPKAKAKRAPGRSG